MINISSYYEIYDDTTNEVEVLDMLEITSYKNKNTSEVLSTLKDFGVKTIIIGDGNKVIDHYPSKGIKITNKDLVILLTNDNNHKIPDFTGLSMNETKTLLSYLDIQYTIEGNGYVVSQSIAKDTLITDEMVLNLVLKDYYVKEEKK